MTETSTPVEGNVPLGDVDQELRRLLGGVKEPGEGPVQVARMSNLVIYTNRAATAQALAAEVPAIVATHPARVLLLVADPDAGTGGVTASVNAWCQRRGNQKACSEEVVLRADATSVDRLPFVVRSLLVGDLPTNLWWAAPVPPPLAGPLLYELAERAQQVIYDSIGWPEPARGVAATGAWIDRFERGPGQGLWRVISDLNWRRLKYWRRLLTQALDPASAPGALESITELQVEHGPHAVVQALLLVSWLASRLGWKVAAGRAQPGVEVSWQVQAPHGQLRVRIRRLAEGPSEVRQLRFTCLLEGKPGALNCVPQDGQRLAAVPEGITAVPRTVTVQPQPFAELVARQLSDRERDPVFRESMEVAQVFAQSILGA